MYVPDPTKKVLNPAGEWNNSKIVFTPERVEHWLNGKLLLTFVPWSEEWNAKKNNGKNGKWPKTMEFTKKGLLAFKIMEALCGLETLR